MKSVTIIRHAKSSWDSAMLTDFDRPLDDEGSKDAKLMGNILADKKTNFDIIISSSANRAISTAEIIAKQLQFKNQIKKQKSIYSASIDELLNIIFRLDNNINSIALVGHNPTFHILSERLSNKKFMKFPTCSIVKINFDINLWKEIHFGKFEYFLFPDLYKNIN